MTGAAARRRGRSTRPFRALDQTRDDVHRAGRARRASRRRRIWCSALDALDDAASRCRSPAVHRVKRRRWPPPAVCRAARRLTWWLARGPAVPGRSTSRSRSLIADFQNATGDASVRSHARADAEARRSKAPDSSAPTTAAGIRRSLGVRPPGQLDEQAATRARGQAGRGRRARRARSARDGSRLRRVDEGDAGGHRHGDRRASRRQRANKDQVLAAVDELATTSARRSATTRRTPRSALRWRRLSATSLDVVREYAAAMEALSRSQFDDALQELHEGGRRSIRTSASPTPAWRSPRATSTGSRTPRNT